MKKLTSTTQWLILHRLSIVLTLRIYLCLSRIILSLFRCVLVLSTFSLHDTWVVFSLIFLAWRTILCIINWSSRKHFCRRLVGRLVGTNSLAIPTRLALLVRVTLVKVLLSLFFQERVCYLRCSRNRRTSSITGSLWICGCRELDILRLLANTIREIIISGLMTRSSCTLLDHCESRLWYRFCLVSKLFVMAMLASSCLWCCIRIISHRCCLLIIFN